MVGDSLVGVLMMQPEAAVEHDFGATEEAVSDTRRYATLTFVRGALVALALALLSGVFGVLYYIPAISPLLVKIGLDFTALRPLHTTFASAWIFLGGVAVVHRYLEDHAGPVTRGDRIRLVAQVSLWLIAGAGILVSLAAGVSSGREYMGFHPVFSIPILLGWLLFAWNFFRATWRGFWSRPVYVTMWGVGVLFFIFTFVEQHAWLLPGVFADPIVDLRVQWKACGTLVGSFNLFVYGSIYYIAERLSGDKRYAYSRLAYALFSVSMLNSFTNFGHHTYHLPQSSIVNWISFLVSMTEIVILARVIWDVAQMVARRVGGSAFHSVRYFLVSAKWWTIAVLFTAILISIPPVNTLIHGTHVVTAHAMGSEIGIDTMVLFAGITLILTEIFRRRSGSDAALHSKALHRYANGFNVCAALLVVWLNISGSVVGYTRYLVLAQPVWFTVSGPFIFMGLGLAAGVFLALQLSAWLSLSFRCRRGVIPEATSVAPEPELVEVTAAPETTRMHR
ncbi:MAG: cbb3-type cytochrome c oxidase subunit I [Planctomycetota bacterium]